MTRLQKKQSHASLLKWLLFLFSVTFYSSLSAQVQLGARPGDSVADEDGNSAKQSASVNQENRVIYRAPEENAPIRRREAGFVTEQMDGSANRGINRGINRGANRGINRGINRGANRGMSRGVSRGANRGANRGVNRSEGDEEQNNLIPDLSQLPQIIAPISPLHTGWTLTHQPTLYWYLSDPWPGKIHFTLNEIGQSEPLLEMQLAPSSGNTKPAAHLAGIHVIDLAQQGIKLSPNREYEWFVFIIVDPDERSADFLASATIKYQPATQEQQALFAQHAVDNRYEVYAQYGYWYDAISSITKRINQTQNSSELRAIRADLIEQVKMPLVAQYDRM